MAYNIQYRPGERNHCPGCNASQWIVGRFSAECAICSTALEIAGQRRQGFSPVRWRAAA